MPSGVDSGGSFTALLGMPTNQALRILSTPETSFGDEDGSILRRIRLPSDVSLLDRAARFSSFASPCRDHDDAHPVGGTEGQGCAGSAKGSRNAKRRRTGTSTDRIEDNAIGGVEETRPYVHVRARRGQATDSHSLAERARREKINARMKVLQDLVPGCGKVTGTALILDEIINHVHFLQRQVEYLSMRLAAVNSRIDFGHFDKLFAMEYAQIVGFNTKNKVEMEEQTVSRFLHDKPLQSHQLPPTWEFQADTRSHDPAKPDSAPLFG